MATQTVLVNDNTYRVSNLRCDIDNGIEIWLYDSNGSYTLKFERGNYSWIMRTVVDSEETNPRLVTKVSFSADVKALLIIHCTNWYHQSQLSEKEN